MQRSEFVPVRAKFCKITPTNSEIIAGGRTGLHTRINPRYSQPHINKRLTYAVLSHMSAVSIVTSYAEDLEYNKHKRSGSHTYFSWYSRVRLCVRNFIVNAEISAPFNTHCLSTKCSTYSMKAAFFPSTRAMHLWRSLFQHARNNAHKRKTVSWTHFMPHIQSWCY